MSKKKVLLVWWEIDHRPEFLQPFIDISDELEFVQLIYKNREERATSFSPFPMIYWHDYKNAQHLLNAVQPDVIVGVPESIFCAALIDAARAKGISFYGLQHGYTTENIADIAVDTRKFSWGLISSYIKSTAFFLRSFSIFNFKKFRSAVYFYWLYPKMHVYKLLTDHKFPWLVPDYYICFSPYSAEYYKKMYGMEEGQVKYIGILWFDTLFRHFAELSQHKMVPAKKYYLLIDTSFSNYHKPISAEEVNRCYHELSEFCKKKNARLMVKLHPLNYYNTQLPGDPNIEFIRKAEDAELHKIIVGCEGCFGFYSTLILPILSIKPLVQISYDGIYLKETEEDGLTPVIDFFTFTRDDIDFPTPEMLALHKSDLDYLIYKSDGFATERLKNILLLA